MVYEKQDWFRPVWMNEHGVDWKSLLGLEFFVVVVVVR